MEKGSFSLKTLRWDEVVVEVGVRCQKLFFSGGDGCLEIVSIGRVCFISGLIPGDKHHYRQRL